MARVDVTYEDRRAVHKQMKPVTVRITTKRVAGDEVRGSSILISLRA
jgi:hypothetical protein